MTGLVSRWFNSFRLRCNAAASQGPIFAEKLRSKRRSCRNKTSALALDLTSNGLAPPGSTATRRASIIGHARGARWGNEENRADLTRHTCECAQFERHVRLTSRRLRRCLTRERSLQREGSTFGWPMWPTGRSTDDDRLERFQPGFRHEPSGRLR
jgi:hypothetical protein